MLRVDVKLTMTISRKCDAISADGLAWASIFTESQFIAAPLHEIIISSTPTARLDQLSIEEERACWSLAWDRANNALNAKDIKAVGFIVNDGITAGQTVGHIHIHLVGFHADRANAQLNNELEKLTTRFVENPAKPFLQITMDFNPEKTAELRHLRQQVTAENKGFSIFTNTPQQVFSPSNDVELTIQAWSADAPRKFGFTNLLRVWHGYRAEPYIWPEQNKTLIFVPAKDSTND
jgi:diadenosine tetraphosphate (Ap4A) HIT family hydrolase